jgi:hypothetical protein
VIIGRCLAAEPTRPFIFEAVPSSVARTTSVAVEMLALAEEKNERNAERAKNKGLETGSGLEQRQWTKCFVVGKERMWAKWEFLSSITVGSIYRVKS